MQEIQVQVKFETSEETSHVWDIKQNHISNFFLSLFLTIRAFRPYPIIYGNLELKTL